MPNIIEVTSRPEVFRRAGLKFTREPRELEVDDKTLKVLAGEANLKVIVLPGKKPANSKPKLVKTSEKAGTD